MLMTQMKKMKNTSRKLSFMDIMQFVQTATTSLSVNTSQLRYIAITLKLKKCSSQYALTTEIMLP